MNISCWEIIIFSTLQPQFVVMFNLPKRGEPVRWCTPWAIIIWFTPLTSDIPIYHIISYDISTGNSILNLPNKNNTLANSGTMGHHLAQTGWIPTPSCPALLFFWGWAETGVCSAINGPWRLILATHGSRRTRGRELRQIGLVSGGYMGIVQNGYTWENIKHYKTMEIGNLETTHGNGSTQEKLPLLHTVRMDQARYLGEWSSLPKLEIRWKYSNPYLGWFPLADHEPRDPPFLPKCNEILSTNCGLLSDLLLSGDVLLAHASLIGIQDTF